MYSRAPMRISFGGGNTDLYPYRALYGGCSLGAAIQKYAYSRQGGSGQDSPLVSAIKERMGYTEPIRTESEAPPYSGLGASGALSVATIGLISKGRMSRDAMAEMAFDIERNTLDVKGGAQDQYWAAFGGFQYIEFGDGRVNIVPMVRSQFLDELERKLLLVYLGPRKDGLMIHEDEARRTETNIDELDRIKEIANEMRWALRREDLFGFSVLLHEAWKEKRRLSSLISNSFIDEFYEDILKHGVLAGKLSGAGGGGYMMLVCEDVGTAIERIYGRSLVPEKVIFDWEGVQVSS